MILKKTIGFKMSFIALGAVLSACNAYLSGHTSEKSGQGYAEIVSANTDIRHESPSILVKNSRIELSANTP